MDNNDRDNMLIEIHGDMKVVVKMSEEHHQTLYGKDGVKDELGVLRERQDSCPAREAATGEGKRHRTEMKMLIVVVIL